MSGKIIAQALTMEPSLKGVEEEDYEEDEEFEEDTNHVELSCRRVPYYSTGSSQDDALVDGNMFVLNKSSFGWRDLEKFTELGDKLKDRTRTRGNAINKKFKPEPVLIPFDQDDSQSTRNASSPPISMVGSPVSELGPGARQLERILSGPGIILPTSPLTSGEVAEDDRYTTSPRPIKHTTMAVCLPCYDEEWCEMSGTLRSLAKSILVHRHSVAADAELHVIVIMIQDGKDKASDSLIDSVVSEFGAPLIEFIDENTNPKGDEIMICLPEAEVHYPATNDHGSRFCKGAKFYPVFVTKSKNCMKFNSHLIFFAMCNLFKPDCCFLTDCGSLYNDDCIHSLVHYLVRKHDKVVGVTARQRVMSSSARREVQEYPLWCRDRYSPSSYTRQLWDQVCWWLSPAPLQGFEFESTFLLNTSMFNIIGALPVLPGPCQLLWWEHLDTPEDDMYEGPLDMYFR